MTYKKSRRAPANVGAHALSVPRTVVYVITMKLRTVASSPSSMTETGGTNAVAVVKTTIGTADN